MSGDFCANLYRAVQLHPQADSSREFIKLSPRSALISITGTNVDHISMRLDQFLVAQAETGRQSAGSSVDGQMISRALASLDLLPGKTLLVQQEKDGSVSLSAAPVGQKVTVQATEDGGRELLAVRPRQPKTQNAEKTLHAWAPSNTLTARAAVNVNSNPNSNSNANSNPSSGALFTDMDVLTGRYERDGDATASIRKVRVLLANGGLLGSMEPLGSDALAQSGRMLNGAQRAAVAPTADAMRKDASELALEVAVTASGARLSGMQQQSVAVSQALLATAAEPKWLRNGNKVTDNTSTDVASPVDKAFVDIQEDLNGLKDSIEAAKHSQRATLTGEAAAVPPRIRACMDVLSTTVMDELVYLNSVYADARKPTDAQALSRSKAFTQHRRAIMREINAVYRKYGLDQRLNRQAETDPEMARFSIRQVVKDALTTNKRLFLHKLRNNLITTMTGRAQFESGKVASVPVLPARSFGRRYQVQQVYVDSKPDRAQGHYQPLGHNLLSNFAWLYAGINNKSRSKQGEPKAINLILANPTHVPEQSVVDADKLFSKGDPDKGLSGLGYELAFLKAAGFQVGCRKLDPTTGLTKIKLTPPARAVQGFEALLLAVASGFLREDYQSRQARAQDTERFLTSLHNDPDWSELFSDGVLAQASPIQS